MQVHISEARVGAALDKLAYVETLVNDKLLQEKDTREIGSDCSSLTPSTSSPSAETMMKQPRRRGLNVSGPVQPYHPNLKNFWYPVAFSRDLKEDTMVGLTDLSCFHPKMEKKEEKSSHVDA